MRKIAKILSLLVLALTAVTLVACKTTKLPTEAPTTAPTEAPTTIEEVTPAILGVDNISLNVGEKLEASKGVTATGYHGEDVTSSITINGLTLIPVDEDGNVTTAGTYSLNYRLTLDGEVVSTKYATVTVVYVRPVSDDILANGDLESGSVDPFTKSEFEGGLASISVVDGKTNSKVLKVDITVVGWTQAPPRVEQAIELESGKFYEVSFKAYADQARTFHLQFGELLAGPPYFIDVDPTVRYFELTTDVQTFTFRFRPDESKSPDLSKVSMALEFGKMTPTAAVSVATACYFDDFSIVEVDSLGEDTTAPTITLSPTNKYYVGDEFDYEDIASATDDQDDSVVVKVVNEGSTLPVLVDGKLTTVGNYVVKLEAEDEAGNKATASYEFSVQEAPVAGSEIIKNNDFSDATAIEGGFTDWLVFSDAGTKLEKAIANGKITFTINNSVSVATWNPQFKQENLAIQEGKTYKLQITLKSSVNREVQIGIQNAEWWNMHIEKYATLIAGEEQVLSYIFTAAQPAPNVIFFLGLGKLHDVVQSADHTLEVSGLSLKETTEAAKDETAPVLTVNAPVIYKLGDAFDSDVCTALDAVDGEVAVSINDDLSNMPPLSEGLLTTAGNYKIVYEAVDAAGNKGTTTYLFIVKGENESPNLFGVPADNVVCDNTGAGDEKNSKLSPNVFHVWYDPAGWVGAPCVTTAEYIEGVLELSSDQPAGSAWFSNQLFYTTSALEAGQYILSFDLESNVAGDITVCGKSQNIKVGKNTIIAEFELASDAPYTVSIQFGAEKPAPEPAGNLGAFEVSLSEFTINLKEKSESEEAEALEAPVGIVANKVPEGYSIAFAAVANAVSYKAYVYKGDVEVNNYNITNGGAIPVPVEAGTYRVFVKAIGDGTNYSDSPISTSYGEFIILDANAEITLVAPVGIVANKVPEGYVIAFAGVANAVSYKAYVYKDSVVVNSYNIPNGGVIPAPTEAGTYLVKVQSLGNGDNIKDSSISVEAAQISIA